MSSACTGPFVAHTDDEERDDAACNVGEVQAGDAENDAPNSPVPHGFLSSVMP